MDDLESETLDCEKVRSQYKELNAKCDRILKRIKERQKYTPQEDGQNG